MRHRCGGRRGRNSVIRQVEALESRWVMAIALPPAEMISETTDAKMAQLSTLLLAESVQEITMDLQADQRLTLQVGSRNRLNLGEGLLAYPFQARLHGPDLEPVTDWFPSEHGLSLVWKDFVASQSGTYTLRVESQRETDRQIDVLAYIDTDWTSMEDLVPGVDDQLPFRTAADGTSSSTSVIADFGFPAGRDIFHRFQRPIAVSIWTTEVSSAETGRVYFEPAGIDGGSLALEVTGEDPAGPEVRLKSLIFRYDSLTGNLSVESLSAPLTALEIMSPDGLFTGPKPSQVGRNPFDVYFAKKLFLLSANDQFILTPESKYELGPVLAPGLSLEQLQTAFQLSSAFLGSGGTTSYIVRDMHEPLDEDLSRHATVARAEIRLGEIPEYPINAHASLDFKMRLEVADSDSLPASSDYGRALVRFSTDGGQTWGRFYDQAVCVLNETCDQSLSVPSGPDVVARFELEGINNRLLVDDVISSSPEIRPMNEVDLFVDLEDGDYLEWSVRSLWADPSTCHFCAEPSFEVFDSAGNQVGSSQKASFAFRDKTLDGQTDVYRVRIAGLGPVLIEAQRSEEWSKPWPKSPAPIVTRTETGILLEWDSDLDASSCSFEWLEATGAEWTRVDVDVDVDVDDDTTSRFDLVGSLPPEMIPLTIPAGACTDLLGRPTEEWHGALDYLPPELIGSSMTDRFTFSAGTLTLKIGFSELVSPQEISPDWTLTRPDGSIVPLWARAATVELIDGTYSMLVTLPDLEVGRYSINSLELPIVDTNGNESIVTLSAHTFDVVATELLESEAKFDLDRNNRLDLADLAVLRQMIQVGKFYAFYDDYDLNEDGRVDGLDEVALVRVGLGYQMGDVNLDGRFDDEDLLLLSSAYLNGGTGWQAGDLNGDGVVDSQDLIAAFQAGGYSEP